MRVLGAAELLSLWERGMSRHALDRAALLAATAHPNWPADAITDLPLGAIGSSLLRLRAANFGPRIEAHADCQQCGERLAVALEVAELLHGAAPEDGTAPESPTVTVADGLQVRASSLRDQSPALRLMQRPMRYWHVAPSTAGRSPWTQLHARRSRMRWKRWIRRPISPSP
jgi:hypothetical protein